ncbi:hypothetical protein N8I84_15835 [Streptomyces cynarae]|uniref:Uncharacterized protein n=1 Tax=Streptomyces cynarae TaxID=2981134 RepID=A0ABY6E0C8_9ACTN|nr:hypothetical protein [Streptomyces cynarae]UXY20024.1 hypothetical protein N8I84_15835 [Streptomyces cynarae]
MQWTDESGRTYGEDPYGGVGYPYAHGYDHGGSAVTDTATMPWDSAQLEQWTHPGGDPRATGPDPYATGMASYAAGTQPHATGHLPYATGPAPAPAAWDAPHGDVLTVPLPDPDAPGHVPAPDAADSESVRPVFVDSSGRRQRRVLRAARLLLIPAGGYVALLISAALGGPTLDAPFVPQPDPAHHPAKPSVAAPDSSPEAGRSAGSASPTRARQASRPTARPTASTAPAATSAPTAGASPAPAATHAAAPTPRGRAIGSSHKPVK